MLVTMTDKELYRLGIIQRVCDRALLQRDAADILKLSVRQVQRLVRLYRTDGATAFAYSRRGRPANNRIEFPPVNPGLPATLSPRLSWRTGSDRWLSP